MIAETFATRDTFAFEGAVSIDVRSVDPGVIAITGDNGKGKTAVIEIPVGVIYGKLPAREDDPPVAYANSPASFMEYGFRLDTGERYRALMNLDGPARVSDGLLERLVQDGSPVRLNDGKVSTFRKAFVDLGFPSFELFINSSFAAQGRGDEFARTKPSARKELFAQFLGLAQLLAMAKTAGQMADLCEQLRDRLVAVRNELVSETGAVYAERLDRALVADQEAVAAHTEARATALADLSTLEPRLAAMHDAVAAHGAATLRVQALRSDLTSRETERLAIIKAQQDADAALTASKSSAQRQHDRDLADVDAKLVGLDGKNPDLEATLADIDKRIAGNDSVLNNAEKIRHAAGQLKVLQAQISLANEGIQTRRNLLRADSARLRTAEGQLAELKPVEQSHDRAVSDAALLDHVPCHGESAYAACQFLQNAQAARSQIAALVIKLQPKADLADQVGQLLRDVKEHEEWIASTEAANKRTEAEKAQHVDFAALSAKLDEAPDRLKELRGMRERAIASASQAIESLRAELAAQRARIVDTLATSVQSAIGRHTASLADLDTRLAALAARIVALKADLVTAEQDLAKVAGGNTEAASLQDAIAEARTAAEQALTALTRAQAGVESTSRERAALEQKRARVVVEESKLEAVEQELMQWRGLAKDLGKGGLADVAIDASVDTISATANALMLACYGAKFSIQIITQSAKADGSGMKDDFDVLAIDNEDDRGWRPLRTFSGGQRTIIQEAFMCSIAIYVNERSPMPIRTLWRDETGGQLDASNAKRYVEMLREVRRIGNLHHVFFISHNAESAQMADAQIRVENGTATLVLPPFDNADVIQAA